MEHLRDQIDRNVTADLARLLSLADNLGKDPLYLRCHTARMRLILRPLLWRRSLCLVLRSREKKRHHKAVLIEKLRRHTRTDLEQLQRTALRCPCLGERNKNRLAQPSEQREQQLLFRGEVIVERPDTEIRRRHDICDRRLLVALLRELTDRGFENHLARLQLLALTTPHLFFQTNRTLSR